VIKTFSYRLKDSTSGKHLSRLAAAVNQVWNFCNEAQHHAVRWSKPWVSPTTLCALTAGSGTMLGLHSQTVQAVCQEYVTRRRQHRKRWLRWRGKRSPGWIPFKASGIAVDGDRLTYAGRPFRCWLSRPIEGEIKSGSFSQDARGRWYVNLACECLDPAPTTGTGEVGIDLGLTNLLATSEGEVIEAQRFYRDLEPKLAVAQRARKKRQAKALHAKITNRRKDFLHQLSTRLVNDNCLIAVGNVNAAALAKTRMAKSVLDAGWSMLRTFLSYKAIARKARYVEPNEAFSTQDCSVCGARTGPKGDLSVRAWTCGVCFAFHHRDINSARVILRFGRETLLREESHDL
jgi:putative transposase